ncbi:uncharacterized protein LOC115923259 [Strongylocentrotus purpuratus]|uniref:Transposase Helix-turn-helix domain-containing protein n=1 Tax=Strongylocentrotus purpuratus TaxID=7668 RepID=A0A7M7NUG5_STRPU|nr:uncharacterized protein LOC115923259 [Strongylocentrotus purpuratus]
MFKKAIPPGLKLFVFLRHLATGATYAELSYNFRVSKEAIQKFVPDVARAIVDEYTAEVISLPQPMKAGLRLQVILKPDGIFLTVSGAYDGKAHPSQKPNKSGSLYFKLQAVLLGCPDGSGRLKVPVRVDRCGWVWPSV